MSIALAVPSFSAITSYGDLVEKVTKRIDRDDLTDEMPTFVALTEHYLNRELRTPEMEAWVEVIPTGSIITLPGDLLEVRMLTRADRNQLFGSSPGVMAGAYVTNDDPGVAYSREGGVLRITSTRTDALTLAYWRRIPPLTAEAPFNWLLDTHADIYFYGCLMHAEDHVDNPAGVEKYAAAFQGAVERLSQISNRARHPGPIRRVSGARPIYGVNA